MALLSLEMRSRRTEADRVQGVFASAHAARNQAQREAFGAAVMRANAQQAVAAAAAFEMLSSQGPVNVTVLRRLQELARGEE